MKLPHDLAARTGTRSAPLLVILLACVLLLAGCATPHAFQVQRAPSGPLPCAVPMQQRDVLVGIAMSGGGSRAALFGAASLEALAGVQTQDGKSVLEHVDYLSSVSGGSIAASYYVLKKPARTVPMLSPDGKMTDRYRTFFDEYRKAVGQRIGSSVFWRQISRFRWINPASGARSLTEILSERLLGDATMMDVARREASGDSPGLIINTTLYNNGRRLALTNHSSETFRYNFFVDLEASLARQGKSAPIPSILLDRWQTLLPMTPHEIRFDVCGTPLAAAVAASASFPPVIGPITFQVEGDPTFWHAGDGGLYENQGAESILFMALRQLQLKNARRALILAVDSSFPFAVGDIRLNRRAQPFGLLSFDFSRIPSIMEERATTYRALFFRTLQMQGVFPDDRTVRVLSLRHIDAIWNSDLSDLPAACRNETPALRSPAEVRQRLAEIPTLLRIKSECDGQLLVVAAAKVVAQNRDAILELLNADPAPEPGAAPPARGPAIP